MQEELYHRVLSNVFLVCSYKKFFCNQNLVEVGSKFRANMDFYMN